MVKHCKGYIFFLQKQLFKIQPLRGQNMKSHTLLPQGCRGDPEGCRGVLAGPARSNLSMMLEVGTIGAPPEPARTSAGAHMKAGVVGSKRELGTRTE